MLNAAIFACVGTTFEVVFTALCELRERRNWRLMGWSYLWMPPIYGLAYPFLLALWPLVGDWAWPLRGALYVALLYAMEYATGRLLRAATGACPWDYGNARWAVHGVIRLDYAPAWLLAVLLFERLFLALSVPGTKS